MTLPNKKAPGRVLFYLGVSFENALLILLDVVVDTFLACVYVSYKACDDQSDRTEADSVVVVPRQSHTQRDEDSSDNDKNKSNKLNLFCHSAIFFFVVFLLQRKA